MINPDYNMDQRVLEILQQVLLLVSGAGVNTGQAVEIYARALLSCALEEADGDNRFAAELTEDHCIPMLRRFAEEMRAKGGRTEALCSNGRKLDS